MESWSPSKAVTGAQDLDMYCAVGEILETNSLLSGVPEGILQLFLVTSVPACQEV